MPFLIYALMLIAVLSSVALGLDWVVAPPQHAATVQVSGPRSIPVMEPAPAAKPVVQAVPATPDPNAATSANASAMPGDDKQSSATTAQSSDEAPAPHCNVQACSSAYVSFRESDCTYQPYEGPRRLCEK